MRSEVPATVVPQPGRLTYAWRTAAGWQRLTATTVGDPGVPAPSSEAAFITEHYWGYARQRDWGTVEYEVTHPVWRIWATSDAALEPDVAGLYGPVFVTALTRPPSSALVAEGSPVTVHWPRRLGPVGRR